MVKFMEQDSHEMSTKRKSRSCDVDLSLGLQLLLKTIKNTLQESKFDDALSHLASLHAQDSPLFVLALALT